MSEFDTHVICVASVDEAGGTSDGQAANDVIRGVDFATAPDHSDAPTAMEGCAPESAETSCDLLPAAQEFLYSAASGPIIGLTVGFSSFKGPMVLALLLACTAAFMSVIMHLPAPARQLAEHHVSPVPLIIPLAIRASLARLPPCLPPPITALAATPNKPPSPSASLSTMGLLLVAVMLSAVSTAVVFYRVLRSSPRARRPDAVTGDKTVSTSTPSLTRCKELPPRQRHQKVNRSTAKTAKRGAARATRAPRAALSHARPVDEPADGTGPPPPPRVRFAARFDEPAEATPTTAAAFPATARPPSPAKASSPPRTSSHGVGSRLGAGLVDVFRPYLQGAMYQGFQPADLIALGLATCALYYVWLAVPLVPQLLLLPLLAHVVSTCLLHVRNCGRLEAQGGLIAATSAQHKLYQAQIAAASEVADEVVAVRLELARLQQEADALPHLKVQVTALQEDVERRQAQLARCVREAAKLSSLRAKLRRLRQQLRAVDRCKWAVDLLQRKTTQLPALRAKYDRLQADRATQQALRAELQALQRKHDDIVAALAARRPLLEKRVKRANDLRAAMEKLKSESAALPSVQTAHADLVATVHAQRNAAAAVAVAAQMQVEVTLTPAQKLAFLRMAITPKVDSSAVFERAFFRLTIAAVLVEELLRCAHKKVTLEQELHKLQDTKLDGVRQTTADRAQQEAEREAALVDLKKRIDDEELKFKKIADECRQDNKDLGLSEELAPFIRDQSTRQDRAAGEVVKVLNAIVGQ